MPASRLTAVPVTGWPYVVVATARNINSEPPPHGIRHPVHHVAMLSPSRPPADTDHELKWGSRNPCDHVRVVGRIPKVVAQVVTNARPRLPQQAVAFGHVDGLVDQPTDDQARKMQAYVSRTAYRRVLFLCHPPVQTVNPVTKRSAVRYSCVGFVLECYRRFVKPLLRDVLNNPRYPQYNKAEIAEVWPEILTLSEDELDGIGLDQTLSSWPVVVPGYVMHALNQPAGSLPYQPMHESEINF